MATLQERLQMKRVPIDKWSIKEQLCLASAVSRSGDQNWMSVSRALKPFAEPNRPPDWFSQKNCAAQYGLLLENVETPKRKKRMSGSTVDNVIETPQEIILKKLTEARKTELRKKMEDEKREYLKLQEEMEMIRNGTATDEMIERWNKEIEEEEKQKAQDAVTHAQWLKQREERKLEVERAFRPVPKITTASPGQKRKASESIDSVPITESTDESNSSTQEPSKPALSPLLTSLLKTPAHVPNVTSSILHSAITNQRGTSTSPTIASLLNTTASVPVSPSLQQLVSTAISQEPTNITSQTTNKSETVETNTSNTNTSNITEKIDPVKQVVDEISLLESNKADTNIVTINNDDLLGFSNVKDEIKSETKDETKQTEIKEEKTESTTTSKTSEVIHTAPVEVKLESQEDAVVEEVVQEQVDIYDFDNNSKTSSEEVTSKDTNTDTTEPENDESNDKLVETETVVPEIKKEPPSPEETKPKKDVPPGSVEIVEVVVMDDEDSDKEMNKKVSEIKRDIIQNKDKNKDENLTKETIYAPKEKDKLEEKTSPRKETTVYDEYDFDDIKKDDEIEEKPKTSLNIDLDANEISRKSTFTPDLDTFYDDMNIEVTKTDKSGKAKRVYSRAKKKEEKDLDMLLTVEKVISAELEENDGLEETSSEKDSQDSDKKSDHDKTKLKDTERSNSPWTEEETEILPKTRRRLSATPATPSDSIPNSPASGIGFEDDRDYRTWKKSVMLVYNRLVTHKCASLFLKPITDEQAPGYHSIVYRPMDLQTIRKNIENGVIRTTAEFQRDVLLMFNNAIMYNRRNEMVYQMALQMQKEGLEQIQILLQVQTQVETPARRETRTSESGLKRKRGQEDLANKNKKRRDD